ncbi:MAG: sulfatase [Pirellulales bacterium]|nr:sulfatase [Pirellulales bacterium]
MHGIAKLFCLFILATPIFAAESAQRPNVVLIISDDHAWTDYSLMGHARVQTPNIDRLAREGLTFTRGYVATAICSPSLATMLTGLHAHQHGITGNDPVVAKGDDPVAARDRFIEPFLELPQLPRLLKDAGYRTMHTGKFWMRDPELVGFTDHMGPTGRHGGQALAIGRETMAPIERFLDSAIAQKKPFFLWYAPFLPHVPHNPPERLLKKFSGVADPAERKYLAMVEWMDETTGELLGMLDDKNVADNTLVIYLADNGWNAFGKAFPYENGVRTPIILRWPNKITPRIDTRDLATNLDLMPTILDACNVGLPKGLPGVNLLDPEEVRKRKEIFLANYAHDMVSVDQPEKSLWTRSCIDGNWKLIVWQNPSPKVLPYNGGHRRKTPPLTGKHKNIELFDLAADPHETKNVAAEHPERVDTMLTALDNWWESSSPSLIFEGENHEN